MDLQPKLLGVIFQNICCGSMGTFRVTHLKRMADVVNRITHSLVVGVHFMAETKTAFRYTFRVPVNGLTGIVSPELIQPLVTISVGLAIELGNHIILVRIVPVFNLLLASNCTKGVPNTGTAKLLIHFFNQNRLCALFDSCASSEETRSAGSDYENLSINGLNDILLLNNRGFTQPVRRSSFFSGGCRLKQSDVNSFRLGNAGFNRLANSIRGDARTGNRVDHVALPFHDLVCKILRRNLADGSSFSVGIDDCFENALLINSNRNGNIPAYTGSGSRISAGNISGRDLFG